MPSPGGKEIHVHELSRRQAEDGHRVMTLHRLGSPPIEDGERRRIPVPLPPAIYGSVPSETLFCAIAARSLAREHRRRPFDVVHVHGDFPEARLGGFCASRLGLPAVMTVHGALSPRWVRTLSRAIRPLEAVICVGDNIRDQLLGAGAPLDTLHVISSGVDVKAIRSAAKAAPDTTHEGLGRPLVVAAGALDPVKGYDTLLQSFATLRSKHPNAGLGILGEGPERRRLQRAAPEGTVLLGTRPRHEVWSWLGAADVVAVPSRQLRGKAEGVPTVLLEALALRRPIVAARSGGIVGLLGEDVGKLVAPDDAAALGVALLDAIAEGPPGPVERARMDALVAPREWGTITERVTGILAAAAASRHRA